MLLIDYTIEELSVTQAVSFSRYGLQQD